MGGDGRLHAQGRGPRRRERRRHPHCSSPLDRGSSVTAALANGQLSFQRSDLIFNRLMGLDEEIGCGE